MKARLLIGFVAFANADIASARPETAPVRHVDISLGARLEYDSNVLRGGNVTGGHGKGDIIAAPTLGADILLPFARSSLFLNGTVGYRFYRRHDTLNREAINLNGGGTLALGSGCSVDGLVSWRRQQTDLGDLYDSLDPKNTEQAVSESARARCGIDKGVAPSLGLTHRSVTNSAPLRRQNNYDVDTIEAAIGYSRPLLGTVSIYAAYSDATYPDRVAIAPGSANDGTRSYQAGLRYERDIGARLRGTVSLGWTKVDPKFASVPDFDGLSYAANITALVSEQLQFVLAAARTVEQSNLLSISYSITDTVRTDAKYAFSPFAQLGFGTAWTRRNLRRSPAVADPVFVPDDRLWDLHAALSMKRSARLSFALDASYRRRSSTAAFNNYSSLRAGISAYCKL